MSTPRRPGDLDELIGLDEADTRVLSATEERKLLRELADCQRKLKTALERMPRAAAGTGPLDVAHYVAATCAHARPAVGARLGAIARRYTELRARLAMANLRLVAHVAKRFRDRGIAYSDLMQEGFCGLLEAIDRFDLTHETKLATYATWWIRQAMQRAVAAGAYPVRLSPRHLRQLAQNQDELERTGCEGDGDNPSSDLIRHIHTATRPAFSLDASLDTDGQFSLLQTMSDPEGDRTDSVDTDETIGKLMHSLRPREQEVLAFRFGLGGQPRLSLSQVGKALSISKERVRQIQDRALAKLRDVAAELGLAEELVGA
jgi:RNA polymerase primary sigma factor